MKHRPTCYKHRLLVLIALCVGLAVAISVPAVALGATPEGKAPSTGILASIGDAPSFGELIPLDLGSWRDLGTGGTLGGAASVEVASQRAEVIVQFARGADTSPAGKAAARVGARLMETRSARSRVGLSFAVYSSDSLSVDELAQTFEGVPGVAAVAPNSMRQLAVAPNDPAFNRQWGLENTGQLGGTVDADIDASTAWDVDTGSAEVVVAVIDTGVDYANPDLAANMWHNPGEIPGDGIDNDGNGYVDDVYGIDTKSNDSDPNDTYGHGTAAAGAIAAVGNNGVGMAGVGWNTKIMALRAGDQYGLSTADVDECIQYAIDMKLNHGVNVVAINASFGGSTYNEAEKNTVQAAGDAGIIFCAAADNQGTNNDASPRYPASYTCSNIISVGASNMYDEKAYFSNYGATSVDLFAPGESILTTAMSGREYYPGPADFFFDDVEYSGVELPYGGWTPGGSWTITTSAYASPTHSWTDSVGYLANNADVRLTSPSMDLSQLKGKSPRLGFACVFNLEQGYDFIVIEMSGNGGSTWTTIGAATGDSQGWRLVNIPIPDELLTSTFKLRFRSLTDSIVQSEGFTVDDVGIEWPGCTTVDGTSFAAPYVAGSVGLLASAAPWQSMSERIAEVLASVDTKAALSGLCVTGGRLNVGTALQDYVSETVQQTDGRLTFLGGWASTTASAASGGSYYYTDKAGSAVNVSFTGTSLSIIGRTTPWYGKADVTVDGVAAGEADFFSWSTGYQKTVYNTGELSDGAHTLTLQWSGEKNTYSSGTGIAVDAVRAWSSVTQSPSLTRYEQGYADFEYTGTWTTSGTDASASGGTFASAEVGGSTVTVEFTGTAMQWLARTAPWYGTAKVVLDAGTLNEQETPVDLYSSSVKYKQVVYSTGVLENDTHTVSVYWTGQHNPAASGTAISVDAFEFLGTPAAADPAPPIQWRYQENDPRIAYFGSWSDSGDTGWQASGNSFKSTAQTGATTVIKFTGTKVTPVLRTTPWYGIAEIFVDGVSQGTQDLYSPSIQWKLPLGTVDGLSSGEHTIMVKCTGQKNGASSGYAIGVDAFDITGYLDEAITKIDDNDYTYFSYDPGIASAGASTSAWSRWDASGYWAAYMDTYAYTDQDGFKTTFSFEGTYAAWVAATSNTKGKAKVTLDGDTVNAQTVDLYSPNTLWKQKVYDTGLLAPGSHTIEIECLYEKNPASVWYTIDVDRFEAILTTVP